MTVILLGGIQIGFSLSSANQLATLLNLKYGWPEDKQAFHQSLIGSSIVVGLTVGAMIGGKVI